VIPPRTKATANSRRRIKTFATTPDDIGLTGCWHLFAVERTTIDLTLHKSRQLPETEFAYYVSSRTKAEASDEELLQAIVGHWDAIENGTHRVRDVSMGEYACRVANPNAARNMVNLGKLAIGLYNLLGVQKKPSSVLATLEALHEEQSSSPPYPEMKKRSTFRIKLMIYKKHINTERPAFQSPWRGCTSSSHSGTPLHKPRGIKPPAQARFKNP
jgi:hypothetical protein